MTVKLKFFPGRSDLLLSRHVLGGVSYVVLVVSSLLVFFFLLLRSCKDRIT